MTDGPEIILPYPHPGQIAVRTDARRFNWLAAGRRWRKTTLVMAIAVEAAIRRQTIVWGAPTYDQVRIGWQETKRAATGVAEFNQSTMTARFPGGGQIIYRSLDNPDNARGHSAGGIVIDESADVVEAAWYEVLRPMLIDTGGWLWAGGTPKGRNWYWREFVKAADRADSRAWTVPTLGCRITDAGLVRDPHPLENPEIDFGEMVHLYETLPERVFRQEILSEFIEDSGGVFRKVREAVDVGRSADAPKGYGRKHTLGIDLARVQDFTVLCVLEDSGKQVYLERFNQISWERQVDSIHRVARDYNATVFIDSTGVGDPIFERLKNDGLDIHPYQFTNQSKEALIDNLAMMLERGGLRLLNRDVQTNELLAYQYELTPSRNVRMNAPAGMHDDTVIALALAAWGIGREVPALEVVPDIFF